MTLATKKTGGRRKRRQPRKGFPHRIVAYLDVDSKRLLDAALRITGENTSMFTAKAVADLAKKVVSQQQKG